MIFKYCVGIPHTNAAVWGNKRYSLNIVSLLFFWRKDYIINKFSLHKSILMAERLEMDPYILQINKDIMETNRCCLKKKLIGPNLN